MEELIPEVVQAVAGEDCKVYAYFNDGTIHCFDVWPLIIKEHDSVFSPLKDPKVFKETLTVMNGTVAWDFSGKRDASKCVDLDPYVLYASSRVSDPLA